MNPFPVIYRLECRHPGLFFVAPPFVVAGLIFILSGVSGSGLPSLFPWGDKIVHFIEYAVLSATALRAWHKGLRPRRNHYVLTFVLCALDAFSDELHQCWVPGRFFDLMDFAADVAGVIFGIIVWHRIAVWIERNVIKLEASG